MSLCCGLTHLPERVLSGHMAGIGARDTSQKQCVHHNVREDLQIAGLSHTWWENPETGQAGVLPFNVCCRAPDLKIEKHLADNDSHCVIEGGHLSPRRHA